MSTTGPLKLLESRVRTRQLTLLNRTLVCQRFLGTDVMILRGVARSTSNSDCLTREGAPPRTQGSRPAAAWRAFHSNHEFADRRRVKQRRIKVSVHVPLCVRLTIGGPLMEAPLNRGTGFRRQHRTSRLDVSECPPDCRAPAHSTPAGRPHDEAE